MIKFYDRYGVFFVEEGEIMLEGYLVVYVYEKLKGDKQCLEFNKVFIIFDLKLVCEKILYILYNLYVCSYFLMIVYYLLQIFILLDYLVFLEFDY